MNVILVAAHCCSRNSVIQRGEGWRAEDGATVFGTNRPHNCLQCGLGRDYVCVCVGGGGGGSVGMHVHVVWCDVLCNMEWASINGYLGVFHCMVHRCNHIEQMKHVLPTNVSQQWHAFMFFGSL